MEDDAVIKRIKKAADDFARECGYDIKEMFRRLREMEKEDKKKGWKFVDSVSVGSEKSTTIKSK